MRNDIAHQSVQALLDDLAYVTGSLPFDEQPTAARAVLDHHYPAVDDGLLSDAGRRLQQAARATLTELGQADRQQTFDDVLVISDSVAPGAELAVPEQAVPEPSAVDKFRQFGITLAATGAIAAGGFAIGAVLQRLI